MIFKTKTRHSSLFLTLVYKGITLKRYWKGFAQNVHNFAACSFLLEADWFDSLDLQTQKEVYKREHTSAYQRSMKNTELD